MKAFDKLFKCGIIPYMIIFKLKLYNFESLNLKLFNFERVEFRIIV